MKFGQLMGFGGTTELIVKQHPNDYDGRDGWGMIEGYHALKYAEVRGEKSFVPRSLCVAQGHRLRDYVPAVEPGLFFVTKHSREVFESNGLTGVSYTEYPCEALHNGDQSLYRIVVSGKCGKTEEFPNFRMDCQFGMYFDPLKWDGSDVFMPPYSQNTILDSEKVLKVVKKHKLKFTVNTNVFTNKEQWEKLKKG